MLTLEAVFENSEGRKHTWKLKDPDRNKPAEEIKALLEQMTTLDLFKKDGVSLFKKVISAKFVEKIETTIFDRTKEPTGEVYKSAKVSEEAVTASVLPEEATVVMPAAADIQTESVESIEQPDEEQSVEIMIDPATMSEEEILATLMANLPEGATLEDIQFEEVEEQPDISESEQIIREPEEIPKPIMEEISEEPEIVSKSEAEPGAKKKYSKQKRKLLEQFSVKKKKKVIYK